MHVLFAVLFACFGAICASFIGVVAERIHTGHSWFSGRSRCDSCGVVLTPRDLIPLVSWIFALGRCRTCGSRIGITHLSYEGALALLFLLAYLHLGASVLLVIMLLALCVLLFIVIYDIRHTVIPGKASLLLMLLSVLFALMSLPTPHVLGAALVTAGAISLSFVLLHVCSRGRAMGLGDAPVALALSLLCAPYALTGLLFSFWIGAVIGIAILVLRRGGPTIGIEVPFAPFLAAGFLLAYFTQWNLLAF